DEDNDDAEEDTAAPAAPDAVAAASDAAIVVGDDALLPILDASFGDVARATDARGGSDALTAAEAAVPDSPGVSQTCYVAPATSGGVVAVCATAGPGIAGSACRDSRDCASGLGCVQVDGAGLCESFSCGLPPSCLPHFFYQLEPLIVGGVALSTVVP